MKFLNQGFDHVEWAVKDFDHHADMWRRMGFEEMGRRGSSVLFGHGMIRALITPCDGEDSASGKFLKAHGDGITVLAVEVDDATAAFEGCVSRGARPAMEPRVSKSANGRVVRAEIFTPSDFRYAFIERTSPGGMKAPALFDAGLEVSHLESPAPLGLWRIDHLTNNVSIGEMSKWVEYYKKVFGFKVVRHFDISTGRTGLTSDVVRSSCGLITVPINEATEPESQVQEFVERFKGPGVQHLALLAKDIIASLKVLRTKDYQFLTVPHTYYEDVPKRVAKFDEDINTLEELGILLDGEGAGYLLQIFTQEMVGPFFFEFIQRKGNNGFGEGNFKALFESIERDQVQRGVLPKSG